MKRFFQLVAVVSFLAAVVCFSGCATGSGESSKPTPQAVAYFTLADTWDTVDGAMQFYGIAVAEGRVDAAQQRKIDAAHEKFRRAFQSALRLARHDYASGTPANVTTLANEVLYLLQEFH